MQCMWWGVVIVHQCHLIHYRNINKWREDMKISIILIILLLVGCVSSARHQTINTSDGRIEMIEAKRMGDCYEKANQICPSGYAIVNQETEQHQRGAFTMPQTQQSRPIQTRPGANVIVLPPPQSSAPLTIPSQTYSIHRIYIRCR